MTNVKSIRVAIVDDHALIRRGIRDTLHELGGFSVVAEGASADDAVAIARKTPTDVMLVDINMPGGGVEAVKAICDNDPHPRILMLTVYDNMANVKASLRAGASGYALKGVSGEELASILRNIHGGKRHISPELAANLLSSDAAERDNVHLNSKHANLELTDRDRQIHELIAQGASNLEIGKRLGLKETTIKQYASQLFKKLGVKNRTEAAVLLL